MSEDVVAQAVSVPRVELCCRECAQRFAVDRELVYWRRLYQRPIHCPLGHDSGVESSALSAVERVRDAAVRDGASWRAQRNDAQACVKRMQCRVAALQGAVKRVKARAPK